MYKTLVDNGKFTISTGVGFQPSTVLQGSLNYPCLKDQTMQMYNNFEGFPLNSPLFGLVI